MFLHPLPVFFLPFLVFKETDAHFFLTEVSLLPCILYSICSHIFSDLAPTTNLFLFYPEHWIGILETWN